MTNMYGIPSATLPIIASVPPPTGNSAIDRPNLLAAAGAWSSSPFGGTVVMTPGSYLTDVAPVFTDPTGLKALNLIAAGAEIQTLGPIYGLVLKSLGAPNSAVKVSQLRINQRLNTTAIGGIDIQNGWKVHLEDCIVQYDGSSAAYNGCVVVENSIAADDTTSSFWTVIENSWIRKFQGGDNVGSSIQAGVVLRGPQNATRIIGGGINNTTDPVLITRMPGGGTALANGVVVDGLALEVDTNGIVCDGIDSLVAPCSGLRVVNGRFESVVNCLLGRNLLNADSLMAHSYGGNTFVGCTNYMVGWPANFASFVSLDLSDNSPVVNPTFGDGPVFVNYEGTTVVDMGSAGFRVRNGNALQLLNGAGAGASNNGGAVWFGTGAPVNGSGTNGDLYFRVDGGALTTIYQRRAAAWVGIV